jgi:hypothetical protein
LSGRWKRENFILYKVDPLLLCRFFYLPPFWYNVLISMKVILLKNVDKVGRAGERKEAGGQTSP